MMTTEIETESETDPKQRVRELEVMVQRLRQANEAALEEVKQERERRQLAEQRIHRQRGLIQTLMSAIEFLLPATSPQPDQTIPDEAEWPLDYVQVWAIRFARDAVDQVTRAKESTTFSSE